MFVIIGNPPYNVGQVNENDNNRNRKYPTMDARVKETYAKDSTASNKNALSDPYVKAIRWASDRIGEEGIVAFVTNNSFLDAVAFDGMRKNLADDFDAIYILDLSGNVRKNPKLSGTTHNVFGIQVGVSINFFVKRRDKQIPKVKSSMLVLMNFGGRRTNIAISIQRSITESIKWQSITPDRRYTWLTEGLRAEFEDLYPDGHKKAKRARGEAVDVIFKHYGRRCRNTSRDAWVYNLTKTLWLKHESDNGTYNEQVFRWERRAGSGCKR